MIILLKLDSNSTRAGTLCIILCNPGSRTNKWILNYTVLNCKVLLSSSSKMDNKVHRRNRLGKEAEGVTCRAQMQIRSQSLKDALGNLEFMEVVAKPFGYLSISLR